MSHILWSWGKDNYIYTNNMDDGMFILISLTVYTKLGQQYIYWRLVLPLKRTLANEEWAKETLRSSTEVILHLGQNNTMPQYGPSVKSSSKPRPGCLEDKLWAAVRTSDTSWYWWAPPTSMREEWSPSLLRCAQQDCERQQSQVTARQIFIRYES